ncbi:MAG: OadG family protein [Firmicutes bacterium]|nr:OadG family protein [Bacillota bacterium]
MSFGEIIKIAGEYTALGMGIVFAILIFISLCIWLMGLLVKGKKPAAEPAAAEPAVQPAEDPDVIDPEIIAVITAAIHQYIKDENGDDNNEGYVVRKVRRATWKHTS